jgi:N-methylhydantoinase A
MGGTSFDVSLVADGEVALAAETSVDFGMVIRAPMIEITTIGAGGGSIASLDKSNLLQVGPESAGSDPGPVCYGQGNARPTVTDANLVLGRINPERPIGDKLERLDIASARHAIKTVIGDPLGMEVEDAAEAILRLAIAKMAGAIRLVSIERGHDPARFSAMPFGGGGALHTGALIREVGLGSAIVPRFPGVTSALGCVVADMRQDRVQTVNTMLSDLDTFTLGQEMKSVAVKAEAQLDGAGIRLKRMDRLYQLDMLYLGQTHTINVDLEMPDSGLTPEAIQMSFDYSYRTTYGRLLTDIPVRVMNYRVAVVGRRAKLDMKLFAPENGASPEACQTGERKIYANGQWLRAGVFDRLRLNIGAVIEGPALLEQSDATIYVDPGLQARVDDYGNLIIIPAERSRK